MAISTKRKTKSKMMLKTKSNSKSRKHLNKSRKTIKTNKRLMKGGSFTNKLGFRPPSFNAAPPKRNLWTSMTTPDPSKIGTAGMALGKLGSKRRERLEVALKASANPPQAPIKTSAETPRWNYEAQKAFELMSGQATSQVQTVSANPYYSNSPGSIKPQGVVYNVASPGLGQSPNKSNITTGQGHVYALGNEGESNYAFVGVGNEPKFKNTRSLKRRYYDKGL